MSPTGTVQLSRVPAERADVDDEHAMEGDDRSMHGARERDDESNEQGDTKCS